MSLPHASPSPTPPPSPRRCGKPLGGSLLQSWHIWIWEHMDMQSMGVQMMVFLPKLAPKYANVSMQLPNTLLYCTSPGIRYMSWTGGHDCAITVRLGSMLCCGSASEGTSRVALLAIPSTLHSSPPPVPLPAAAAMIDHPFPDATPGIHTPDEGPNRRILQHRLSEASKEAAPALGSKQASNQAHDLKCGLMAGVML